MVSSYLREVGTFIQLSGTGVAALIQLDCVSFSNSNCLKVVKGFQTTDL